MSLRTTLRGAVFAGTAAFFIALPMTASAIHGEDVNLSINSGNVPTTAAGFEDQNCDNLPALGENEDGWVFVIPAQGDPGAHFNSVTATFTDNEGGEQVLNATLVEGAGDNKAYIVTEAGWTLIGATASVNTDEPDMVAFFNLTHACPGAPPTEEPPTEEPPTEEPPTEEPPTEEPPTEEPPTDEPPTEEPPTEEPPTSEETTPPMEEETTPPKQDKSQPPAEEESPTTLPVTGEELGGLLAAAGALMALGLGAYFLARRRTSGTD